MRFAIKLLLASLSVASAAFGEIDFTRDIRPILSDKCFTCHGPDANTREADLRLDLAKAAEHVVTGDDPPLLQRVTSNDPDERMPPADARKQLAPEEIKRLQQWVAEGARYERHWSFVSPRRPELPKIGEDLKGFVRNEIDHFIIAALSEHGLSPSTTANRNTLLRRVTLDLTGLPPTPNEVDDFLKDEAPDAWEHTIDRLMNSPRYGEHMAAAWLDLGRYADTDGYQNDRYRYQHVWRDWVIMAYNENMPYDQFLIEQLAGDMLPDATFRQQVATGFCRNHRINSEDGSIPAEWHVENVVDRVDTMGTAILGLTVGCARCHDHKYDPLTQREYYQFFAYFNNVPEWGVGPNNGNSPPFVEVPESWPNLLQKEDVARTPEPLKLHAARKGNDGNGLKRPQAGSPTTVMVMAEMPEPRKTYLLRRGQYSQPDTSEPLTPGVPAFLDSVRDPQEQAPRDRLGLAQWLVRPDHPLTARVAVNRMWQRFFGTGLVKTSENFGLQGELPSHPELLDWLATELVASGWDMRAIQKMILMSATYRQSSTVRPEHLARDPENRLLARGPRFRLHPFVLRDQALAASGLLYEKLGGPSAKPYMPPKIWRAISNNTYKRDAGPNLYRRSLYTYWRRTIPPPTMLAFNAAEREVCVARKDRTNTPLQALTMMNNMTFVEASRFLAERMMSAEGDDEAAIRHGFLLMTGREPSVAERALLSEALVEFSKRYQRNPAAARKLLKVGEKPGKDSLDPGNHAAMTMVASMIMNLDETVTRE